MMALTPRAKLATARMLAARKEPYLAPVLLALVPRETPGFGTLGVSRAGIMRWDPAVTERWTLEELAAVLVHECHHVLRKHGDRADAMGAAEEAGGTFNIAADAAINCTLIAGGWKLPDGGGVTPKALGMPDGLTTEEYYARLREKAAKEKEQQQKEQQSQGNSPSPGNDGDDKSDSDGESNSASGQGKSDDTDKRNGKGSEAQKGEGGGAQPAGAPSAGGSEQSDGDSNGDAESSGGGSSAAQPSNAKTTGHGHCGGCAGHAHHGEPEDETGDKDARSQADLDRARREVAAKIVEMAQKGRGTLPGDLVRWAEKTLEPPQVPWRTKLRRMVRHAVAYRAGASVKRFTKLSRRQAGVGFGLGSPVLPSYAHPVARIAVVMDTSGSMGTAELTACVREIKGVLKAHDEEVDYIANDARVASEHKVRRVEDLIPLVKGGGGTDFRPPFELLDKRPRQKRPEVVIFLTDGMGPAPAQPPRGMRVLWVLVGPYRQKPTAGDGSGNIAWGEFVEVESAKELAGKHTR